MIIPSIDIQDGRAVQLRHGRELILEGGDPFERLDEFSVAGEVAVVDLDAALGRGSNAPLIHELIRRAPCRVGGGIRDLDTALDWLDAGAAKIMIGTAAAPEFCAALPRERVIAAVDAERGEIVVEGWRKRTGVGVIDRVRELAPLVGGFLLTQVEKEGALGGFDQDLVREAVEAAAGARVIAAGGVRNADEIHDLDRLGADAQVGMALYSGKLPLGDAVAAVLRKGIDDRLWPTVVCDENGSTLGLVWSTRESLAKAVAERRGIYWSRSRGELWIKGATSGATQRLLRVDLDCDRDALRFTVRQEGTGFCHTGSRGCWGDRFDLGTLERTIAGRRIQADEEDSNEATGNGSGTVRLLRDSGLLAAKLGEESQELAAACSPEETVHEASDLLYFLLVAAARQGVTLRDLERELARRSLRINRRPMLAKESQGEIA